MVIQENIIREKSTKQEKGAKVTQIVHQGFVNWKK